MYEPLSINEHIPLRWRNDPLVCLWSDLGTLTALSNLNCVISSLKEL